MATKKKKQPLYVLKVLAHHRDIDALNQAFQHKESQDTIAAWSEFHAHERATGVLTKFGYDVTNDRVKGIVALAVRAVLDEEWAKIIRASGNKDGGMPQPLYSSELDVPFSKTY